MAMFDANGFGQADHRPWIRSCPLPTKCYEKFMSSLLGARPAKKQTRKTNL
jgi:hypothetical protein